MLTSNLALDGRDGTELTFNAVSDKVDGGILRRAVGATFDARNELEISHRRTGSKQQANQVFRHLIKRYISAYDGAGVKQEATVNLTINVPESSAITANQIKDALAQIVDLICDGGFSGSGFAATTNLDAILAGES
jgi:lipopolysaccharide export LptBFGC system permease protein LptF